MKPLYCVLTLCSVTVFSSHALAEDVPFLESRIAAQQTYADTCVQNTSVFSGLFGGLVQPQKTIPLGCDKGIIQASFDRQIDNEYLSSGITDQLYRKGHVNLFDQATLDRYRAGSLSPRSVRQYTSEEEVKGGQNGFMKTLPGHRVLSPEF